MDEFFLLYGHCIIVNGSKRSTICDLQRNNIHFIPNTMVSLFSEGNCLNINSILNEIEDDDRLILSEYLNFLDKHELGFFCSSLEIEHFPKLNKEWLFPAFISNCILDTQKEFDYFNQDFINQLSILCCNFLQFRFYKEVRIDYLNKLLELINPSQIKSIAMVLPLSQSVNFETDVLELVKRNKKISQLVIFNSNENKLINSDFNGMGTVLKTTDIIVGHSNCGIIHSDLFSINMLTFTESLAFNTCLNRKLSIDIDGNIKNCPSMSKSYGNIKNTKLVDVVNNTDFQKLWHIKKDDITKCKDCEFRHICTDCRAFIDNPEDVYSAPLKCGYDPYTNKWEDWSTLPFKQKAIEFYGLNK